MLDRATVDALFADDLPDPGYWQQRYPARSLPPTAQVTRFAPSPTGFVHIGGVYVAMICQDVSHSSGGVYFVRIEDTDQAREVAGAAEQFARAFSYFGIGSDEGEGDPWGPYRQSAREQLYHSYARELLREGRAYPCFCTRDELAELSQAQQKAKVPTGYYGRWAKCRDLADAEVVAQLNAGNPYVVRFRSPGQPGRRVTFTDQIRGRIEHEDNYNDVVVLKSSEQQHRLPTYHFAHAVDDHVMAVTLVIRGEEWISSVPLHLQLFAALGFDPVDYAHIAPLMKQEGASRRKLSKRKDPEASVDFYIDAGFPAEAVLYYLKGLANGRLAELPLETALKEPIQLALCSAAGPLIDLDKLRHISANYIADLTARQVLDGVGIWSVGHAPALGALLRDQQDLALRVIDIERVDVPNPRKDLTRWADFEQLYGFFFAELFTLVDDPADERFGGLEPQLVRALAADFVAGYVESPDQPTWFGQIRELAARHGFAASPKQHKAAPDQYPGSLRDAANVIRVALTGSTRSPDLHAVAMALGRDEVRRRAGALLA
jgi:glutamyl-tRNA synthetase